MTIIPFPGTKLPGRCERGKVERISRLCLPVSVRKSGQIRFVGDRECQHTLLPVDALSMMETAMQRGIIPDLVELSGPGDPLAEPDRTLEILKMIHTKYPEIPLAIKTLGVGGEVLAASLLQNGVTQATLQMEAVEPDVVHKLYSWIRPGKKTVPLARAAAILLDEQERTLRSFCRAGIRVTVRTTVYSGYNDENIGQIAVRAAQFGAEAMMIVPYKPRSDDPGVPPEPNCETMDLLHARAAKFIRIVDGQSSCEEIVSLGSGTGENGGRPKPSGERPNVAVVSSNGTEIDLHLGHAVRVLVYGPREDGLVCLLESRYAPEHGGGSARWEALAGILPDCFAFLAASAGENPRKVLASQGISVLIAEGEIAATIDTLYDGGKKKGRQKRGV